ncbi:hypothetical protein CEX98_11195, partial [Pseudoalteromonas piscicida]
RRWFTRRFVCIHIRVEDAKDQKTPREINSLLPQPQHGRRWFTRRASKKNENILLRSELSQINGQRKVFIHQPR